MKLPVFKILVVFFLLSMLGIFLLPYLPLKLNPSNSLPSVTVNFSSPKTSAYTVEREITSKLEAGFATMRGLQNLRSKSSEIGGYVVLEFDKYTDIDVARFETSTIIRQLYKTLPAQTDYPTISVNRPDEEEVRPFLSYSVNAPENPVDIQEVVNTEITPYLGALDGIDRVEVYGANVEEYELKYNSDALKTFKVTRSDLVVALRNFFNKEALGEIQTEHGYITLSIRPEREIVNWHIPVKKIESRILYLDDLVSVKLMEQEAQSYYRINGNNAITVNLYATKNANTITVAKIVREELNEIDARLPESYSVINTYDGTEFLKQELNKIYQRTAYTLIILLLFILLVSGSFKYLAVILMSLTANICIAFLLYYMLRVEIQIYSLAGITISFGLIIDNMVVMIDHIRHQGNRSIFVAILGSTLTTIGALSIIYFLEDQYKVNLLDFALVIMINLSVSLFIALFLIPAILRRINLPLKKERPWASSLKHRFYKVYRSMIASLLRYRKFAVLCVIILFGIPFYMLPTELQDDEVWFAKAYNATIGSEWYTDNARPYVDEYLGGSFRLFNLYVFENSYYNRNEETRLHVSASMDKGATVHQMNMLFLEIENYLQQFDEIEKYTTHISSGDYARLEITFEEESAQSSFPFILKSLLIRKALDFGGLNWNIYGIGENFHGSGSAGEFFNFRVKAKGYHYDELNAWADSLKTSLKKHPRVDKVLVREDSRGARIPSYEYQFNLDKEQLALTNISSSEILQQLKELTLRKYEDFSYDIGGKYTPIRFESSTARDFDIWHIENSPLDSLQHPVGLENLIAVSKEREDENIFKENQEYVRLVEFGYNGDHKFGSAFLEEELEKLKIRLPLGFSFERPSGTMSFGQEDNNYVFLLVLVMGIIYLICSILFESFRQPIIILSVIPISFIGVFLTFYLFDFNFDQGGMASFILLSGITVNACIFIINDFNKLKKENPGDDEEVLYLQAFKQKIFPVLVTVISTILGFIPFIKDGQNEVFWFALGVGTIGGLLFSLVGIFFYLPIFTIGKAEKTLLGEK